MIDMSHFIKYQRWKQCVTRNTVIFL